MHSLLSRLLSGPWSVPGQGGGPAPGSWPAPVSPDSHSRSAPREPPALGCSSASALWAASTSLRPEPEPGGHMVRPATGSVFDLSEVGYWPICLGISETPLRDRSSTRRFWKLEMKWGIFCSPVRWSCHSWTWLSWTRQPGRTCRDKHSRQTNGVIYIIA